MKPNQLKSVIFVERPIQLKVMTIEQRKMEVMEMLLKVRNESLVNRMKALLKKEMIVGYTTAGEPLTEQAYNERLAKAEKNYSEGKWLSQEDAEKESEQW